MKPLVCFWFAFILFHTSILAQNRLSLARQKAEFALFKTAITEGHSGAFLFLPQPRFTQLADSVENSFAHNASLESFYLKLRFLLASLGHGHNSATLPGNRFALYRMNALDSGKRYLPFVLFISHKSILITQDCSDEQAIESFTEIESINGKSSQQILSELEKYISADVRNPSFKRYMMGTYFLFHHLYQLLYPTETRFRIRIKNQQKIYTASALLPEKIARRFQQNNDQIEADTTPPLRFVHRPETKTAYLKLSSFYKGYIEYKKQNFPSFLNAAFRKIQGSGIEKLILDLRNNEGGGDGYSELLLKYLIPSSAGLVKMSLPGMRFSTLPYTYDLSDDVKGFIDNPMEFLNDSISFTLKEKYASMMTEPLPETGLPLYAGKIVVLTNGGTFSAGSQAAAALLEHRNRFQKPIVFVGEVPGGDVYSGIGCSGQSYRVRLPITGIQLDFPFICFGQLMSAKPAVQIPDLLVYPSASDLKNHVDAVLNAAYAQ